MPKASAIVSPGTGQGRALLYGQGSYSPDSLGLGDGLAPAAATTPALSSTAGAINI